MTLVSDTINVTPSNTATQIVPSQNPTLGAPYNESASYNSSQATPALTFSCTVQIPVEIAWSAVQVLQYFNASNPNTIEIYFVYNIAGGSGNYNTFNVQINCNSTYLNNVRIDLSKVNTIVSLVEDVDPKTSRGTRTMVQRTGEI